MKTKFRRISSVFSLLVFFALSAGVSAKTIIPDPDSEATLQGVDQNFDPAEDADPNEMDQTAADEDSQTFQNAVPEVMGGGGNIIDVDLRDWELTVLKNGQSVATSPISYGTRKKPTPTGTFGVTAMIKDARSARYGNVKMPNAIFFKGTLYGIHAGDISGRSHGCVRLPYKFSAWLYSYVQREGSGSFSIRIHY